jgi:hypothetical protein
MTHTREFFSQYADKITCGENIYGNFTTPKLHKLDNGTVPARAWYDENIDYNWANPGNAKSPDNKIGKLYYSHTVLLLVLLTLNLNQSLIICP